MTDPRKAIFDAVRVAAPKGVFSDDGNILALNNVLDALGVPREQEVVPATQITERVALEIVEHEAIVPEAYKDSVGVWTWSSGITSKSGHTVERYKDNPQPMSKCLAVYIWLLREKYLPGVLDAFAGYPLSEAQLAAALSFHWNTGAIGKADWVKLVKAGKMFDARRAIMNYSKPTEIIPRRQAERNLFFDGVWTGDGFITVYQVAKPSYSPKWSSAKQVDIRADLKVALSS